MWSGLPKHIPLGAHSSGQVLMFEGQICSHFSAFTSTTRLRVLQGPGDTRYRPRRPRFIRDDPIEGTASPETGE